MRYAYGLPADGPYTLAQTDFVRAYYNRAVMRDSQLTLREQAARAVAAREDVLHCVWCNGVSEHASDCTRRAS